MVAVCEHERDIVLGVGWDRKEKGEKEGRRRLYFTYPLYVQLCALCVNNGHACFAG